MQTSSARNILNKKIAIFSYFVVFILLNVADFFNALPGDMDFFKKLLSWTIIGYVFYKASFTEIFIGTRKWVYDIFFIISFTLMSVTKNLLSYARNTELEFQFFTKVINVLKIGNPQEIVILTFLIGVLISVILSVSLLLNNKVERKSFIGSLNLKEGYFKFALELFTLLLLVSFFSLVVFNLFMEWFALAVDAIILVAGLIYYLFQYLHKHTSHKATKYLREVANTGNKFYLHVIELFSNKKTFLIGISFILTLHLLVDTGVYMVPYLIGTENSLYFDALSANGRDHSSLFGLVDFENSQLFKDLQLVMVSSEDFFSLTIIIFLYMLIFIAFTMLLVSSFYFFYRNSQNKTFNLPDKIIFLAFVSFTSLFLVQILPNLNSPLEMDIPDTIAIRGVDIHTNSLLILPLNDSYVEIYFAFIIIQLLFVFFLIFYDHVREFTKKFIVFISLVFFVVYTSFFYISFIQSEYANLPRITENNFIKFEDAMQYFNNPNYFTNERTISPETIFRGDIDNLDIEIYAFSTYNEENTENHKDYLYIKAQTSLKPLVVSGGSGEIYYSLENTKNSIEAIYYLGENKFIFANGRVREIVDSKGLIFRNNIKSGFETFISNVDRYLIIFRMVLATFFYLFGGLAFALTFFRRNIIHSR